jgi:hemoglobin
MAQVPWYECCDMACMNQPLAAPPVNPHFARLGGHEAIVRLVDAFYKAMDTLPEAATIRAMHEPDLRSTKAVLVKYFSEWMGGPKLYTPDRGAPMLRRRHHPFAIDADARDAWMLCMRQALSEVCTDEGLRAELDAAFYKIADFIRNTEHSGETRVHPGRPRETQPEQVAAPHSSKA